MINIEGFDFNSDKEPDYSGGRHNPDFNPEEKSRIDTRKLLRDKPYFNPEDYPWLKECWEKVQQINNEAIADIEEEIAEELDRFPPDEEKINYLRYLVTIIETTPFEVQFSDQKTVVRIDVKDKYENFNLSPIVELVDDIESIVSEIHKLKESDLIPAILAIDYNQNGGVGYFKLIYIVPKDEAPIEYIIESGEKLIIIVETRIKNNRVELIIDGQARFFWDDDHEIFTPIADK
jgi:hypothetical protein